MYQKPALGNELNQKHHSSTKMAAAWVLNEAAGDMIRDATGNRNAGTLAPTVFANLNGSSQYFYRTDADFPESGITGANDFTVQAWISSNGFSGTQGIAGKWQKNAETNNLMYFFFVYSNQLWIGISDDGETGVYKSTSGANLVAGEWAHVAVCYDASAGTADFYKNGSFIEQEVGLPVTIADKTPPFEVGSIDGGGFFNGGIYNLCLFDDLRTAGEIAASAVSWDEDNSAEGNIIAQWMFSEAETAIYIDNTQADAGRDLIPYDSADDPEKAVSAIVNGATESTLTTTTGADVYADNDALLVSDDTGYSVFGFADGAGSGTSVDVDDGAGALVTDIEKVGVSLDFDGSELVTVTDAANLTSINMTLEYWADLSNAPGFIVYKGSTTNDREYASYVGSARIDARFFNNGSSVNPNTATYIPPVALEGLHHILATYDDATNTGLLYLDGVLVATDNATNITMTNQLSDVTIGAYGAPSVYYTGNCLELRIYNIVLSASDALWLATHPNPTEAEIIANTTVAATETVLYHNYRNQNLLDLTAYNNDGTHSGTPTYLTSAYVGANLLVDHDIENVGIGGWSVGDAATTISKSTTQVYRNTYSLKILNGDASQAYARQTVVTVANENYYFHGWFYAPTTINGASQLVDVDAAAALGVTCTEAGIAAGWNEVEFCFEAADASTTVDFGSGSVTNTEFGYWDEVELRVNTVDSGGMEGGADPPAGWTQETDATVVSDATPHSGTNALKVTAGAANVGAKQSVTLVAGEYYTVTAYAQATVGGDSAEITIDKGDTQTVSIGTTTSATYARIQGAFQATGTSGIIYLRGVANTDIVWFDDVSIVPGMTYALTGRDTEYIGWIGGIHSPAIQLDGRAQYASIPHADAFSFEHNDAFSVGVWVKSLETTDSVLRTIVGKYSSGSVGWRLALDGATANDPIMFQINDGANTDWIQVDGDLLGDQEWHFLMATYDGSNSPNGMKIYMDGVPQTTSNSNDDVVGTIITTGDLLIGTDDSIVDYINGFVNWLAIWHRAITPVEVLELQIEPFLPFTQPLDGAMLHGVQKWGNFRAALAPPRLTPSNDLIFRFTYGGSDYDSLLSGSRVRRNASMGTGEATIVLDNSSAAWNGFHAGRNVLGDEGIVTMLLDDGLSTNTITLFTGTVMQVDYDENRVIIKLRDKIYQTLRVRIGSGQVPAIVDGYSPGKLAWHILTNEPDDPFPGMGLDDTDNSSNVDIDHTQHWNWRNMLNGKGYELGAKLTGHTAKWCLDRICKMTNSYIWQGGDGRITFAPPRKNGGVYSVSTTDNIGLSLVTDTIVNAIQIYYNYDTDAGTWEDDVNDDDEPPLGGVAADSQTQFGRLPETDDNNVIWHNTEASANNQLSEQIGIYASPIRMFGINAMLPAFEDDISYFINVTKAVYGVTGQTGIIEQIDYDLSNAAQVNIRARWAW